jgi:hypothetical protein
MPRRPVIGVYGMEEAPEYLVEQLRGRGLAARELTRLDARGLAGVDLLHVFFPPMAWSGFLRAKALRRPTVAHWIGSDVELCYRDKRQRLRWRLSRAFIDCHLAVHAPLVDELARRLGVNARHQPNLSAHLSTDDLPWPAERSVLCYVPPGDGELYGVPRLRRLARRLPTVRFLVCGAPAAPVDPPPNWEHLGLVQDMRPLYARCRVLVRPTRRDGLARMVLEALGYARRVVWSQPFPHVLTARDDEELTAAVLTALDSGPNAAGRRMIRRHFNPRRHAQRLLELYALLLGRRPVELLA